MDFGDKQTDSDSYSSNSAALLRLLILIVSEPSSFKKFVSHRVVVKIK